MSDLSLSSDNDVIEVTAQRKADILEFPKVISLLTVAALGYAAIPIIVILSPVVNAPP